MRKDNSHNFLFMEKKLKDHPLITPKILQNYHIQTFSSHFVPYFKTSHTEEVIKSIKLPDGSQIVADVLFQPNREQHPTILVIHGLGGSSKSYFSQSMSHKAYHYGFNVILFAQNINKKLPGPYEPDIDSIIEQCNRWGLKRVYLVGVSAGGYLALRTIINSKKEIKKNISGVVAISPVVNINYTSHLEKYFLYKKLILKVAKSMVKKRIKIDPPNTWDKNQLDKINSVEEWYDTYKHTFGEFSDLEDFRTRTDLLPFIPNIQTPTLIISSYDDPVIPITPFLNISNPNIITLLPRYGGHGGFFTTKKLYGDLDGFWAQNRAIEFIRLLEAKKLE